MKAKIRCMLDRRQQDLPATREAAALAVLTSGDSYSTAQQVGERLQLSPDTVRNLFRNETEGVLRIGNSRSSRHKRSYTTERYSESAVNRLICRLERGDDPRYTLAA